MILHGHNRYQGEMNKFQFPAACFAKFFTNRLRHTGFGFAFDEFLEW